MFSKIFLSLVTAALTVLLVYGGVTIFAGDEESQGILCDDLVENGIDYALAYEDDDIAEEYAEKGYLANKDLYHRDMSCYFDRKISKLHSFLATDEVETNEVFPPDMQVTDDYRDFCEDNISTYCVAAEALDKYLGYVKVLDKVRENIPSSENGYTLADALSFTAERNEAIMKEVGTAQKVLEMTLLAFDEFRFAYPMHVKYETIIKDLVKYKLELKDVRQQVMQFPSRFIDSTSKQCQ